jgi:hypothetical protein
LRRTSTAFLLVLNPLFLQGDSLQRFHDMAIRKH